MTMLRKTTSLLAVAAAATAAFGCGGSKSDDSSSKTSDAKQQVAQIVDQLGAKARGGDGQAICTDLFTKNLQASIAKAAGTTCATEVGKNLAGADVTFSVVKVDARKDQAVAVVKDQKGRESSLVVLPEDGAWKIARIGSTDDVAALAAG
jgi:hypothetical protein